MKQAKTIYIIIILLTASLPLSEAVKNVTLLLLLISLITTFIRREHLVRNNRYFIIITLFFLSGIISSIVNYERSGIDGIYDSFKLFCPLFSLLFICGNFNKFYFVYYAAIFSTILSCFISAYTDQDFFSKSGDIRLNSISPVNSVAIYVSLVFGITLSLLLTKNNKSRKEIIFLTSTLAFLCFFLLCTSTRGSILSTFISSCFILFLMYNLKKLLIIIIPASIIVLSLGISLNMNFIGKFSRIIEHERTSSMSAIGHRDTTFKMAKIISEDNLFWGVGPSNAKYYFTKDACIEISEKLGYHYKHNDFINCYHAHNLFMNILCERGLIGLLLLLLFFLVLSYKLMKTKSILTTEYNVSWQSKMVWCTCFYATCTTLLNGLFNTTLRNEIGLLTLIIIGVWLLDKESYDTSRSAI